MAIRIATKTRSARNAFRESCIQMPSPWNAPTYSAKMAPTTAYVAAIRIPVKNDGSAAGQRSFRNTWRSVAPRVRIRSSASRDGDANPSRSETVIGKNVTSTMTITLGSSPKPNQMTMSGAMATIGIVCDPTSSG